MNEKTVIIIHESQNDARDLGADLTASGFTVLGETFDGREGIEEVLEKRPDFLITGLILSGADGLEVLEKLKEAEAKTKTVVLSAITHDEIIKKAMNLGALYYMVKPVERESLVSRLKDLFDDDRRRFLNSYHGDKQTLSLDERISKIFISVGIPPHIKGYNYLREGVKMAVNDPQIINSITKKLYPGIGEKYETTPSKVERAIRHAIEVAWNRNRIESINSVFGVRAYVGSDKPTNGEFIALVADKMLLEGA